GSNMRSGSVGEVDGRGEVPPFEQAMAQRAAEGIPGTEAIADLDLVGRDLDLVLAGHSEHSSRPALDDRELDSAVQEGAGRSLGVVLTDRDPALLAVADRHRRRGEGHLCRRAGLLLTGPEHGPVVEVDDCVPAATPQLP